MNLLLILEHYDVLPVDDLEHEPYQLEHTEPPTVDAVEQAVRLFRTEGLTAY